MNTGTGAEPSFFTDNSNKYFHAINWSDVEVHSAAVHPLDGLAWGPILPNPRPFSVNELSRAGLIQDCDTKHRIITPATSFSQVSHAAAQGVLELPTLSGKIVRVPQQSAYRDFGPPDFLHAFLSSFSSR